MTTAFKRGQTFAYAGQVLDGGNVADFTGWLISSQLRTSGSRDLVQTLDASFVDAATGVVSLKATAAQTAAWPVELLVMDIRLQDPAGQVVISETVTINVVERVTYA